jgi:hypothetical protein
MTNRQEKTKRKKTHGRKTRDNLMVSHAYLSLRLDVASDEAVDDESHNQRHDTSQHIGEDFGEHCFEWGLLLVRSGDPPVGEDGDNETETDGLRDVEHGRTLEDVRYEPVPDGLEDESVPEVERNRYHEENDEGHACTFGRFAAGAGVRAHY